MRLPHPPVWNIFQMIYGRFFTEVTGEERIGSVHSKTFFANLDNNPVFITPGMKFKIPDQQLCI